MICFCMTFIIRVLSLLPMLTLGMQVQFNIIDIFPRLETNYPTKKRTNQDFFFIYMILIA